MTLRTDACLSIRLTRFFMKITGFWYTKNEREERIRRAIVVYTIGALIFAIGVEVVDLYYSWGDLNAVTENICSTMPLMVVVVKVTVFILRRDVVLDLIYYSDKYFWNVTYDEFGEKVMRDCERQGVTLLCMLSCATQGTVCSYAIVPLVKNIGKNVTDRVLPFRIWVDLPMSETPYFEVAFTIEMLSAFQSATCFFCFDNLMGILNVHVVGQFRILQNKLENLCEEYVSNMNNEMQFSTSFHGNYENYPNKTFYSIAKMQNDLANIELEGRLEVIGRKAFAKLKECVKQQLVLIDHVGKLEYVFNVILLCQMAVSSIMMCVAGFQILMVHNWFFISSLIAAFSQMLLFTWTGQEIMDYSSEIGDALYCSKWYMIPNTGAGRAIRHALIMMTTRARRACYLSAGKFGVVSMKSLTNILSTTMSYLSILRQMSEELL